MIRSQYFNQVEAQGLQRLAAEQNVAVNTVVRIALRRLLGLPLPEWAENLNQEERVSA